MRIIEELANEKWAKKLTDAICDNGGITQNNKAKLFELRFGYELFKKGISPCYEITGEFLSNIDFGFIFLSQSWRVELMRLEETEAIRRATRTSKIADGVVWSERSLSTPSSYSSREEITRSPEGETLKAIERICQKFERNSKPHKFPVIDEAIHVLLVDCRTFMNGGGDNDDWRSIAWNTESVSNKWNKMYWRDTNNRLNKIFGVFDSRNTLKGAEFARSRLHFLGFVNEKDYCNGSFAAATKLVPNPSMYATDLKAKQALDSWPFPKKK